MTRFKKLDKRLITILAIVFVQMVGASMILPILPTYAQREFFIPNWAIGVLFAAYNIGQLIAGPTLGRWSDRWGRIPILIWSQVGTVIAFIMIAVAPSGGFLFAARLLDGITGGNLIVAQAYITDIYPKDQRTEALGLIWAALGVGVFVGPMIAGFVSAAAGPRAAFWGAAACASLLVILTKLLLTETVTAKQQAENKKKQAQKNPLTWQAIRQQPVLINLLFNAILLRLMFGLIFSTIALWGLAIPFAHLPIDQADVALGITFSIFGLGQILTQSFGLRPLLKRFGDKWVLMIGVISRGIGTLGFAVAMIPSLTYLSAIIYAFGLATSRPPLPSLITKQVSEEVRGQALGVFNSAGSIGTIIGMLSAGFLFDLAPTLQFWVCLAVTGIMTLLIRFIPTEAK